MKQVLIFALITLSVFLLTSCSGNTTTNAGKDNPGVSVSGGSGDDMYYELTITSAGKDFSMNGVTKMFVSSKGDMRTEMNLTNSVSGNKNSAPIVLIGHSDKPDESVSIDDSAKTYTVNHINRTDLNTGEKTQSTVTKIGDEKILGFNCVHARIISAKNIGNFYSNIDTFDIWKSNDVPMQSTVKKLMSQFESRTGNFMYEPAVAGKLKQMGCEGFMVKLQMKTKNTAMTTELTRVENRTIPAGMFETPAGYKEDKSGM
jgi:predicted small secreted protein